MTTTKTEPVNKLDQYWTDNKFFNIGDSNAKKAFFMLGQYCRKVTDCAEKQIAETGIENKFQARMSKLIGYNMSYRNFTMLIKLLDSESLKCSPQLFYRCSGACKELMINSNLVSDKKALSVEDANMSFSLGLYQQFK